MIDSPAETTPIPVEHPVAAVRRSLVLPAPRLLLPILSAGLLYLCYFPVNWGWLGWIALVPFLGAVRLPAPTAPYPGERLRRTLGWLVRLFTHPRRRFWFGAWLGGLAFFLPAIQWMRVADPRMYATWLALAVYCSLYFPVALLILRRVDGRTRLPLTVTVPVVWTALEYLRSHCLGGFPWYLLCHTQHDYLPLIQISDTTGAYGVTFLVALVNALVAEMLVTRRWFRTLCSLPDGAARWQLRGLAVQMAAALVLIGGALGYGWWRLGQDGFTPGPRVALVQGNVPQQIKELAFDGQRDFQDRIAEHYARLSNLALAQQPRPDLLIWPETSHSSQWVELAPDFNPLRGTFSTEEASAWRHDATARTNAPILGDAGRWKVPMLVGLNALILQKPPDEKLPPGRVRYNSALLLQPGDRALVNGFAVCSSDPILRDMPPHWTLVPGKPAGEVILRPGQAMYVQRGERLPTNADAVIWEDEDRFLRPSERTPPYPGQNVVRATERYDKMHRVPFGEFMPLRDVFPFMNRLAPYDNDYSVAAGEQFTLFPAGEKEPGKPFRFGVLICYEDSDPTLGRQYVAGVGEHADFLVNISNDGWFDGTSEHDQHLAICRFRAIECRRSVARSVNMGISAVIDGNGRVLQPETTSAGDERLWRVDGPAMELPTSRWGEFKKVAGVLTAVVPIDQRASLYAAWGDWLPAGCWILIGSVLGWTMLRRGSGIACFMS